MKMAFLPVSILGGVLAGIAGKKLFERIWSLVDEEEPPDPGDREISPVKLIVALVLEGAIFKLSKGLFDHGSRVAFARATGAWPGENRNRRPE
jgi:hypothetical protein